MPTRTLGCSTTRRGEWPSRWASVAPTCASFVAIAKGIFQTMIDNDADLVEINPLAVVRETLEDGTTTESLQCLDAKITIDDSALDRHPELELMRDLAEEDPVDVEAREQGISFIRLDGSIGCMVNGAGLAMTTMDLIKRAGGQPANFLDIGGGAKARQGRRSDAAHPRRSKRPRDPGQHLRRHRPRRRGGARIGRGTAPAGAPRADGRAHRRHELGRGSARSWLRPEIRTS